MYQVSRRDGHGRIHPLRAFVKDAVEIFFCLDGRGSKGTGQSIIVDNVDEYYKAIKNK